MPRRLPTPRLSDRVISIDVLESDGGELSILPSTSAVLGIQMHGSVSAGDRVLAPAGVTGMQQLPRIYRYAPATRSVLVRFTPQGARCLGMPTELASRNIGLADLVGEAGAGELVERVVGAQDSDHAIAIVESFLLAHPLVRDPIVDRAIALLDQGDRDNEERQIARIARTLAISERQLERRFRERVGLSPKRFASLRRFERATQLATRAPSLTHAALAAGYYDQSHFVRDFRRFAGTTPRAWVRREMSDSSKS